MTTAPTIPRCGICGRPRVLYATALRAALLGGAA